MVNVKTYFSKIIYGYPLSSLPLGLSTVCINCGWVRPHRMPVVLQSALLSTRPSPKKKQISVKVNNLTSDIPKEKVSIITCKRPEFNYYKGQTYGKFDNIPLASKGWHHRKSNGDYFVINLNNEKPSVMEKTDETSFTSLGISADVINLLGEQGIKEPTLIQSETIPNILQGRNSLIAAETGCGKTLSYLLPLLEQIRFWKGDDQNRQMNSPLALILVPSRDLCHQIGHVASTFSDIGIETQILTGGHTKRMILNPSFNDVDLLVSTLGVIRKLSATEIYRMHHVRHIVLDEADTLLDDSFNEKLVSFLKKFSFKHGPSPSPSEDVQLTLASATIPTSLSDLLGEIINMECFHKITSEYLHCVQPHVPQKFLRISRSYKPSSLLQLLKADVKKQHSVIIFSNKTTTSNWISMFLKENGMKCISLNGDMSYEFRVGKYKEFLSGNVNILSVTDIGSRGLDTVGVHHVINYDFPLFMADFIHRCGRTGRVGSPQGCHVTSFVSSIRDAILMQKIELSVRTNQKLENVNNNIKRIITAHAQKTQRR